MIDMSLKSFIKSKVMRLRSEISTEVLFLKIFLQTVLLSEILQKLFVAMLNL